MGNEVDAVIEALRIALEEARQSKDETFWKVRNANRWINRLPGAWMGRWRDLKVKGDFDGEVIRKEFIGQLRATLAYLETNRDDLREMRTWSWARPTANFKRSEEPIDAEFKEVLPRIGRQLPKSAKSLRLIK